jgi:Arc/MetJ-type ribon-helix-helix transcriptional regulator
MKLSVSLVEKDVEFLDYYVTAHELESRSAAVQAALRALRDLDLEEAYERAFLEWEGSEDQRLWDMTTGDGIEPGETW